MLYTLMKKTEILQVASNLLYKVDSVGRIRSYSDVTYSRE